jgi:peptidyl-prolyl cis-trans isomerase A (cyclophilin A)
MPAMSRRLLVCALAGLAVTACEKSSKQSAEEAPIQRGSQPKPLPPPPPKPVEPPPPAAVDPHAGEAGGDPHAGHDHGAPGPGGSVAPAPAPAGALAMDTVRAPVASDLEVYLKAVPGKGTLRAELVTSLGTFNCVLYERETPMTVANFVGLATGQKPWTDPKTQELKRNTPFFNGLIFHRVIPDFMVQGGDPLGVGRGGPGYDFADEIVPGIGLDGPGLLAMANAGPGTNGSQFFITEKATPWLTGRHTVFGKCDEVDLVKKITSVPRDDGDRPTTPVTIKKVTIRRK